MAVLIIAERDNRSIRAVTLNTVSAASKLGDELHVLVAGSDCGAVAEAACRVKGVAKVLLADAPHLGDDLAENLAPLIAEVGSARTLANGSYRFSFWPLFDIKMPYAPGVPLPFVPAYAMATSGDILCESRKVVAHGAYAFHLLHDYGIEARLSCDRVTVVHIGGSEANVGEHWVGLSRDLLRARSRRCRGSVRRRGVADAARGAPARQLGVGAARDHLDRRRFRAALAAGHVAARDRGDQCCSRGASLEKVRSFGWIMCKPFNETLY